MSTPAHARKLVKECLETKCKTLDLGNCNLTDLKKDVPKLFECAHLETLVLGDKWLEYSEKVKKYKRKRSKNKGNRNSFNNLPNDLRNLCELEKLVCSGCGLSGINVLKSFKNLKFLLMDRNAVSTIVPIIQISSLEVLDLEGQKKDKLSHEDKKDIDKEISGLSSEGIPADIILHSDTIIGDRRAHQVPHWMHVKALELLQKLNYNKRFTLELDDLNEGVVEKAALKNLKFLNLSNNSIEYISKLALLGLEKLEFLDLSNNNIKDISSLYQIFSKLSTLYLNGNPFLENTTLVLEDGENHLPYIIDFLEAKEKIKLPVKVLLIGNSGAGKSTLLHFLQKNNFQFDKGSTHVLNVESYSIERNASAGSNKRKFDIEQKLQTPDAVFFDFGGQDFYHGLYRLFISREAFYILVWRAKTESNPELRKSDDGYYTYDFQESYWMGQKQYFEKKFAEEYGGTSGESSAVMLVQTHADEEGWQAGFKGGISNTLINSLYVSLTNKKTSKSNIDFNADSNTLALDYLRASIVNSISNRRKEIKVQAWLKDLISKILAASRSEKDMREYFKIEPHDPISINGQLFPFIQNGNAGSKADKDTLKRVLIQLHRNGLILYYDKIQEDTVWLNPSALIQYIHNEILKKNLVEKGFLPEQVVNDNDKNQRLIDLLRAQKIIFEHEGKYIVPNFLPLAQKENPDDELLKFGLEEPAFILFFEDFLPTSIINSLVSCFGPPQSSQKMFWRNQLLFTFQSNSKVLIELNLSKLKISVYITSLGLSKNQEESYLAYIFYCIMGAYWGYDLLNYNECEITVENNDGVQNKVEDQKKEIVKKQKNNKAFKLFHKDGAKVSDDSLTEDELELFPADMYISVDQEYYVSYQKLIRAEVEDRRIIVTTIGSQEKQKEVPTATYHLFTRNAFHKIQKVFISYAHDDLEFRREAQKYLINLERDGIIEIWHDERIETGEDWNEKILAALAEADLVIMLVSQSFIASTYIYEKEMKLALEINNQGQNRIFPVLLKSCDWKEWKILPKEIRNKLGDLESKKEYKGEEVKINDYQFFPIHPEKGRIVPINQWQYPEEAWTMLVEGIRERS